MRYADLKLLIDRNQLEEAAHRIETMYPDFEVKVLQTLILEGSSRNEEAKQLATKLVSEASQPYESYIAKIALINIEYRQGNFPKVSSLIDEILKLNPNDIARTTGFNLTYWQVKFQILFGYYHHTTGALEKAYEAYSKALDLNENIAFPISSATYLDLGEVQLDRELYDSAFDYFTKALEVSRANENSEIIAYSHYNLAKVLSIQGNYHHSLEHSKSALEKFEEIDKTTGVILTKQELAKISMKQGEYHKARKLLNGALSLSKSLSNNTYRAIILHNLGNIEFREGNIDDAVQYIDRSITFWEEIGNQHEVLHLLYDLLSFVLEKKVDNIDISPYFDKFEALAQTSDVEGYQFRLQFLRSLLLKEQNSFKSKAQAQKMLEDLLRQDPTEKDLEISVLLNLLEIKIFEFKTFENEGTKDEMFIIIDQLEEIAETENLVPLKIDIMIIRAKLGLVLRNFTKVQTILDELSVISNTLQSKLVQMRVGDIREEITSQLQKWKNITEKNPVMRDIIEQSRLMEYLGDVSKTLRDHEY